MSEVHKKIGIVVADFNADITHAMLAVAKEHAPTVGLSAAYVLHVPGVYDAPLAVKKLLEKEDVAAVVVLGVVISGGSAHDIHVADNCARLVANLMLQYNKPVALSVIGHGVSRKQALERKDSYARHGVDAVVQLLENFAKLDAQGDA